MSALVRFYSAKDQHTFWTLSITLTTTAKEVCGIIAAKLENGSTFTLYQEHKGQQTKVEDTSKPLDLVGSWGKSKDEYKFLLKDNTKPVKLVRVFSSANAHTFWTVPVRPDATAHTLIEYVAGKLDSPAHHFILLEVGLNLGRMDPSKPVYDMIEKQEDQVKFIIKNEEKTLPPSISITPTVPPTPSTSSAPTTPTTPTTPSTPPSTTPAVSNATPTAINKTPKPTSPTAAAAPPAPSIPPPDPEPQKVCVELYTPNNLPPLPPVLINPPNDIDSPPPLARPSPLDYMVPLMVTDQVMKLITFTFSKLASPDDSAQYVSDYDKLVYLATFPNESVQENALRLITNITTDGTNQGLLGPTPLLAIMTYLCRYKTGKIQMLAAWVLSNLAVNQDNLNLMNSSGALMALMEILVLTAEEETKEQALRALTNLSKNEECKTTMISSGFTVLVTNSLNSTFEDVANLALRVLVNLGLTGSIRDVVVASGGVGYILQLMSSQKEQTMKMASYVLATMSVDGKLNSLITTLGGIAPIVRLLKTPVPFVQEQAVTLVANLALLESNLEDLRNGGVIPPLISLFNGSTDSIRLKAVWAISNLVVLDENQTAFVQDGGLTALVELLNNPATPADIRGRVAWALSNLTQINDFIRQEAGNLGCIPPLMSLIVDPNSDLEAKESALKAVVNLALNYENESILYSSDAVPVLIQVIRSISTVGPTVHKLAFMALVNLSANDKVRVDIAKQGGVNDTITYATTPSLAQENAVKLLTNLLINGKIRSQLQKTSLKKTLSNFSSDPVLKESIDLALNNLAFPADESDYAEDQSVVDGVIQTMLDLQIKNEEEAEAEEQQQEQVVPDTVKEEDESQTKARQKRRTRIAMEILSTERTYVHNLIVLVKRFLNPLTSAATSPKAIIKPDQVKAIFSICDVISNYHSMFLEGLERRLMKWKTGASEQLGDYFSQVDFLTIYSEYINNYNDSLAIYNELRKKTAFVNLLFQCSRAPECNGLDLQSFLIQPIQRIPRYSLLLEDLIRHTPVDHPDHKDLVNSLAKIKAIAGFLNENARLEVNKNKMVSIQQSVDGDLGDLLGWKRMYLKEGKIRIDNKLQFLFLFSDIMLITKPPSRGRYELIKKIPYKTISTTPCDGNSFQLSTEGFNCTLKFANSTDKDSWWEEFQKLGAVK